ncbi:hypothetical protein [Sphingobacterium deserti]|uniref:Uncharacterized protein n=1 Tax=Sphingobacterium deserti TaxID=1229276 RepID=A0A0B8SZR8_9SPHI|nr:hypothetical protein [Sphingobacterium deserti]KGE13462.1 hypothetical protein DI53_2747 [Sphingobacterium deserti]
MAKQFFIPDSSHLPNDVAEQHAASYDFLQSKLRLVDGETVEDKMMYSISYIDSNNDEIVYAVGREHPFKSVQVLALFKANDVYYIFADEEGLQPERLDFSAHKLDRVEYFEPSAS